VKPKGSLETSNNTEYQYTTLDMETGDLIHSRVRAGDKEK